MLCSNEILRADTVKMLQKAFGESALSRGAVYCIGMGFDSF